MTLFDNSPTIGARVILHAFTAQKETSKLYTVAAGVDGNGDAFRHTFWNFTMARDPLVGREWAAKWANAHEVGEARDSGEPTVVIQTRMDAFNNKLGRELAAEIPEGNIQDVLQIIRGGRARIIENGNLVRSSNAGERLGGH
jgi:hypothetical protein